MFFSFGVFVNNTGAVILCKKGFDTDFDDGQVFLRSFNYCSELSK